MLCGLLLSLAWLGPAWGAEGGEEDGEGSGGEGERGTKGLGWQKGMKRDI